MAMDADREARVRRAVELNAQGLSWRVAAKQMGETTGSYGRLRQSAADEHAAAAG